MGEIGQPQRLVGGLPANPGIAQVGLVEAGQHGDRDHLAMLAGRGLGVFHHRASAGGVHGDDRRLQHMDRLHRGRDGVGDIVQLQIEEDR